MAVTYPFDPTGNATSNRVPNENQALSPGQYRDFHFIVPKAAPFYADGLVLRRQGQSQPLVEGVDFYFSHKYVAASYSLGKRIYGSISFYDESLAGTAIITYQTVGGEWTLDDQKILEVLGNQAFNPRVVSWDEVVNYPETFPPIYHDFATDDLVNFNEAVDEIRALADAIQFKEAGLSAHVNASNPHNISKSTVGLSQVANYPVATPAIAAAGLSNAHYLTPAGAKTLVSEATASNALKLNGLTVAQIVAQVTKGSIGLGDVNNYPVANQAQSEEGLINNAYMTPLRVKQAMDALVPQFVSDAVGDIDFNVTKEDVGLGNVENYLTATLQDFVNAASDKYTTSAGVVQYLNSLRGADSGIATLDADGKLPSTQLPDLDKGMVGLSNVQNLPVASRAQAEQMTSNALYMTPLRSYQLAVKHVADWFAAKRAVINIANFQHNNDDLLTSTQGRNVVLGMRGGETEFASASAAHIASMAFLNNKLSEYVKPDDYATNTKGGTVKMRRSGNTLYITTNGNNA